MQTSHVGPAEEVAPAPSDDEPGHLVCCRDPAWLGGTLRAWCGAESTRTGFANDAVCRRCVEAAERMRPGWYLEQENICPEDGRPCPDEIALLEMVARRELPEL